MDRLRNRPWPWGLLGMLALVALGEGAIRSLEPALVAIEVWDWREAGRAAARPEAKGASVLLFGDSLLKLGVRPKLLAEALGEGQRAYNLALCAGKAPSSYFLLRRALAVGARPEAIVVDFHDSFLSDSPEATPRLYAEFLSAGEWLDLALTMRAPGFAAGVAVARLVPSARNRFEIRRAIVEALAGQPRGAQRRATTAALRANWRRNLGAQVMPKAPIAIPADPAAFTWVQPYEWQPDPTNAAYLDRFFELAGRHKIPVIWVLPPLHPGLMARRTEVGFAAQIDRFVARALARFPGLTVVDARGARYDPSTYIDVAHLDRDGSARLSLALGSTLRDRLGRPGDPRRVIPLADSPEARPALAAGGTPVAR